MKNLILFVGFICFFSIASYAQVNPSSTYVNGYYKSNGTYVEGYNRTTPNNTINDNYSTSPNINPHTGKVGTVSPTYTSPSTIKINYTPPSTTIKPTNNNYYYNNTYR